MKRADLIEKSELLFEVLSLECHFLRQPCGRLDNLVTEAIDRLKLRDILDIKEVYESQHKQVRQSSAWNSNRLVSEVYFDFK